MYTMRRVLLLSALLSACGSTPVPDADAGTDAGAAIDAPMTIDAGRADGCLDVSVATWRLALADDVSVVYRARIMPEVGGDPWDLYLEFRRFDTSYEGTFPLGEGFDENYGGCARCVVAFYGTTYSHAFFARSGSITLRREPFSQHLDVSLDDVVLEEVTIGGMALESTPIPGGRCLALADATVTQTFPSQGWVCAAEDFDDGETCHCSCGAPDPDCGWQCPDPPAPDCDPTPLPIENCDAGEMCTWDAECAPRCDHAARVACAPGRVCGFSVDGDQCFDGADPAAIGETCAPEARHCAVDAEGFAMGLCDIDAEQLCRPACDEDSDCAEGEVCWSVYYNPWIERGQGYCRVPPPPCGEAGTSCDDHLDCCSVLCEGLTEGGTGTCA